MTKFRNLFLILLPAILFLAFWQWFVEGNQRLQFLFASPALIGRVALDELSHSQIWRHTLVTLCEAGLGLIAGTILGAGCGLLLWGNGKIDFITRPYLAFIGSIPIFALTPITIMWFGIGLLSKVVMSGFAVFFVSLIQASEGAHEVARQYLGFARSIAAPNTRIIRKIIIPGAVNWVLAGYKLNVGFALMGAFIGEFISSESGLGYYILKASALYDMPRVLFGLLMIAILGLLMTACAWVLQTRRQT